jgi:peptidoglycan/LPS O-acetylase OafA/YrhL
LGFLRTARPPLVTLRKHSDSPSTDSAPRPGARRADIQGLRCVAVVLVMLYHAGVPQVPGGFVGVDVFFVISGFLITAILTRRIERTGRVGMLDFYANRARRLLPAAFLAIAATAALAWLVLPITRRTEIGHDALASAGYVENWRLAARAVNYEAQAAGISPYQHFWSLGVEEQFYLIWPLLLTIAAVVAARRLARLKWVFGLAMIAVFIPSLLWSAHYVAVSPDQAFFVTPTRMWELALGGGLAIAAPALSLVPRPVTLLLGWAGLAAIVWAATTFVDTQAWPGTAALAPTVGAAAVIAAGSRPARIGPGVVLGLRPFTAIGDISYSLYLWHWPLIVVFGLGLSGRMSEGTGLLIAAISVVPATISYLLVERPAQRMRVFGGRYRGLVLGAVCTGAAAAVGVALIASVPSVTAPIHVAAGGQLVVSSKSASPRSGARPRGRTPLVGAEVLGTGRSPHSPQNHVDSISPDPINAWLDAPEHLNCIALMTSTDVIRCNRGDTSARTVIDLIGDSHAMQWLPALEGASISRPWHIVTMTHQDCPFLGGDVLLSKHTRECSTWNSRVARAVLAQRPSLVLTTAREEYKAIGTNGAAMADPQSAAMFVAGYHDIWRRLERARIPVAVISTTPEADFDVVGCVATHRNDLLACAKPRSHYFVPRNQAPLDRAVNSTPDVHRLNFNDLICPWSRCPAVLADILIWRNQDHITATYSASAYRQVGARVAHALAATKHS